MEVANGLFSDVPCFSAEAENEGSVKPSITRQYSLTIGWLHTLFAVYISEFFSGGRQNERGIARPGQAKMARRQTESSLSQRLIRWVHNFWFEV